MPKHLKPLFAASKKDNVFEALIYDVIGADWSGGGTTAKNLKAKLDAAGKFDRVLVRINSPGGDAFEGIAIMNLLRSVGKPITVVVDGLAASAASIIAMAGDQIEMGEGSMMMIHNAWSLGIGDAAELRKTADTLEKVSESIARTYVARTGKTLEACQSLMDAETWMNAEECVKQGFADAVTARDQEEQAKARALAAQFNLTSFAKTPAEFLAGNDDGVSTPVDTPPAAPPLSNLSLYEARLALQGR